MRFEHNPQSWNQVNQQTLKESHRPKFKQPRHVVDPEEAPACPRRYQVRQARGATQQAPGAQAVLPVPFFAAASRAP